MSLRDILIAKLSGCRALCGRAATRAAMGRYAEAMADCDTAVELSEGMKWQPYHTRGLVAKLQAQMERKQEVSALHRSIRCCTLSRSLDCIYVSCKPAWLSELDLNFSGGCSYQVEGQDLEADDQTHPNRRKACEARSRRGRFDQGTDNTASSPATRGCNSYAVVNNHI